MGDYIMKEFQHQLVEEKNVQLKKRWSRFLVANPHKAHLTSCTTPLKGSPLSLPQEHSITFTNHTQMGNQFNKPIG
jgi:hypothetical protein